ncbi:hypothetical protein QBC47DRAFT_300455 [Echria macrotheca]|uniref:Ataxin-10 homolog n=1 Tax=Echria macrotheca TaxID=438768 RepID=A0AAJ0BCF1_9PEZI|nr:hypothetical protein QBC47DRAFT_300455 [Echria macrotheca]
MTSKSTTANAPSAPSTAAAGATDSAAPSTPPTPAAPVRPILLEPPSKSPAPESAQPEKIKVRPPTIEELCFTSGMSCFEGWLRLDPAIGPKTMAFVTKFITRTLEKTHSIMEVRVALAESVEVWIWLTKCFAAGIPSLTNRTLGQLPLHPDEHDRAPTPQETTAMILKNYTSLKEDLHLLLKLMHIARNLQVTPEPEVPQDLCAAAQFDQMLYQLIILCVNVTGKAYDGDLVDENVRARLNEISDMFKKLLVTGLQQAHNWIARHDRNKMSFWSTVLFEEEAGYYVQYNTGNAGDFRPDKAKVEIQNWIERNSRFCDKARKLLVEYEETLGRRGDLPGRLPRIMPLAWNWLPEGSVRVRADDIGNPVDDSHWTEATKADWKDGNKLDKFEMDHIYRRVSMEVDMFWGTVRDPNYEEWVVPMASVEFAQQRLESCKSNLAGRCVRPSFQPDEMDAPGEGPHLPDAPRDDDAKESSEQEHDYNDDDDLIQEMEEEDIDDDDSYGEGPMGGLLTEVPNILDPKQIEVLHMIVKSCILDTPGLPPSKTGENLQKTRCRMFLALECGRSLLREILVFIAVWEKNEQSNIFKFTVQIVEAIHQNALIPFAWQSLRIPKDIISPAQTVLLRLLNAMLQPRHSETPGNAIEHEDDIKLIHFLFLQFRSRIVPECAALMDLQSKIHGGHIESSEFPVDSWDMERAKDGLQQFLELLTTVISHPETRQELINWELSYELITLLKGLEAAVPKKPLVGPPDRSPHRPSPNSNTEAHAGTDPNYDHGPNYEDGPEDLPSPPPPPPPPMQEPAHNFTWSGIKGQILHLTAALLQPPPGQRSPGNALVQEQIMKYNGIVALMNCCVYDDNNRYSRERVQICLKWLLDGSEAANTFLRNLVSVTPPPNVGPQSTNNVSAEAHTHTLRIDGVAGEVKVRVKPASPPPPPPPPPTLPRAAFDDPSSYQFAFQAAEDLAKQIGVKNPLPPLSQPVQGTATAPADGSSNSRITRSEELLRDIITLADEAAKLAMGRKPGDSDETEEEDFM